MGQSYRIRTEIGINKSINIQLDQEFEFLEILSLKLQQEDVYTKSCAEYGVIVGRVTANNGFGLPNARVSVFIPIDSIDESNPLITSIYPYKSPNDRNEDGYRYNLLPYEQSYSTHAATGTLPSRLDVLTGSTAIEIFDKYYKFTAKTNDSGDYMLMGVPQGNHTLVMDVDLSDIGEFSLTPQDLIRIGLATEPQVSGSRFKTSNDLNSLPQIINVVKELEVSPLWGDPELCDIAINRVDFDLRDDSNVDIQPTAIFMGSIFSTADEYRVRKNCSPRDNMGNLCGLTAGPGQILAIRQTIAQDTDGNPVLEQYKIEQTGNIIDGSGAWLTELPMNLDYYVTNEFGEKVLSNNPNVGIPTKGKYRFKVKWQQSKSLTEQTKRPYYLLPNVKEYGWVGDTDPVTLSTSSDLYKQSHSSYYFGLAWSGYTDGFTNTIEKNNRLNEIINCEDTFYQFDFNRVYTPSMLIDEFKKGAKGRFIGIKEIDSQDCESTINKFPANDGFRNFDLIFFLFSILMVLIQNIIYTNLILAHILVFLYNLVFRVICGLCTLPLVRKLKFCENLNCEKKDYTIRIPMITYPECQACDCKSDLATTRINVDVSQEQNVIGTGYLTYFSSSQKYIPYLEQFFTNNKNPKTPNEDVENLSLMSSQALGGFDAIASINYANRYKLPISQSYVTPSDSTSKAYASKSLPLGERINLFNQRKNYFIGLNKIEVTFAKQSNIGKSHYDNTLTVISNTQYNSGDLLTFISPNNSTDKNYLYSANTVNGLIQGISGQSYNSSLSPTSINVGYANGNYSNSIVSYNLPYGSDITTYQFPSDIEYYQVITALTVSQAFTLIGYNITAIGVYPSGSFPDIITQPSTLDEFHFNSTLGWISVYLPSSISHRIEPLVSYEGYENQYILILQRGVDPYSPKYDNEYKLGTLFGSSISDPKFTITTSTRINIPIQKLNSSYSTSVQSHSNQSFINYSSYFFSPGIPGSTIVGQEYTGFTTNNIAYYGGLDSNSPTSSYYTNGSTSPNTIISKTTNGFWFSSISSVKYDNSEDVSGMGIMSIKNYNYIPNGFNWPSLDGYYYTKALLNAGNTALLSITYSNSNLNIMRTDRLPTSDKLDGGNWNNNPAILQQNLNFAIYTISDNGLNISTPSSTTGASQVTPDIEGLPNSVTVLESFNCEKMVGLKCYEGFGSTFQIKPSCSESDMVDRGCYLFMRRPILDIVKDYKSIAEWAYRFRFFYGLCRGVLSQSFVNNWINGSLYVFPIQIDVYYDKKNQAKTPVFCNTLIYFDKDTTNFYYRSSPYSLLINKFTGRAATQVGSVNDRNLMFPTTLMNLGFKDSIYSELSFDPATNSYIIPDINSTSYSDASDLVNLFVISRITDEGFLRQIISLGDNSINQLFSRPYGGNFFNIGKRVDGDFAQLLSINSEIGNISFSPEYYEINPTSTNNPTRILGTSKNPAIAVWFSSTTANLQTKDYVTTGRINFRSAGNTQNYPYYYGIKTQVVPFYQWGLNGNSSTIFGNQYNTWATNNNDIVQGKGYQSLDRTNITTPTYFISKNLSSNPNTDDLNKRGYIFSVDVNGNYSETGVSSKNFIVGAPFHFYFGVIKGQTSLDLFKRKYTIDE